MYLFYCTVVGSKQIFIGCMVEKIFILSLNFELD